MAIICITMLSNPAVFFGAMLPIKPHIITMFALGESYAGHFVCKWGGCAPSNPPLLFKGHGCLQKKTRVVVAATIDACTKKQASGRRRVDHSCLHQGKATRVILFANGGGCAPPKPPRFLKAMDACKKTKQGSGRRQHRCLQKTSIRSSPCGSFMFCTWGKLRGSFCLQMGGGCAPPTPPLLKAVDA